MPTIGDVLRMVEPGRFTTSGRGATLPDELDRRAREERSDEVVRVTDAGGALCGYLTLRQVWSLDEVAEEVPGGALLPVTTSDERRLSLLRLSYASRQMSLEQNAEVSNAIDALLGRGAPIVRQASAKPAKRRTMARVAQRPKGAAEQAKSEVPAPQGSPGLEVMSQAPVHVEEPHAQAARVPHAGHILREMSFGDEVVAKVERLAYAYRQLGRSVALERYVRTGLAMLDDDDVLGPLTGMNVSQILKAATSSGRCVPAMVRRFAFHP